MNRFAPLFSEITDSSVWEEPYHVRILWLTMLAKKQSDHVVYADSYKLKKWSNITVEECDDALRILSSPDERRKGQEHEGKRIQKVDGGWLVLNGQKYEDLMRKIAERVRKARWAREHRGSGKPLPGEAAYEAAVRNGNEAEANRILNAQPGV